MKIDYARYYQRCHPGTPEDQAVMSAYYHRIFAFRLPTEKTAPILDVGCGIGISMVALKELGYTFLTGVDCDEGQIAACRNKGLDARLTPDTVAFLNSNPSSYRTILAFDVIEHNPVSDQMAFVQALAMALMPGGRLICTVPNANSVLGTRWRYNDLQHHCSFTENSLEVLLHEGGLTEIVVSAVEPLQRPSNYWIPFLSGARHWWAFRFFRFWRRLEMMAELGPEQGRTVPLSMNLLAVARKA